jgi:hypothetical protein
MKAAKLKGVMARIDELNREEPMDWRGAREDLGRSEGEITWLATGRGSDSDS